MNNGNEPAYPKEHRAGGWDGLTKRELFAAMMMQGFASDSEVDGRSEDIASCAVRWADALLAELAKEPRP